MIGSNWPNSAFLDTPKKAVFFEFELIILQSQICLATLKDKDSFCLGHKPTSFLKAHNRSR